MTTASGDSSASGDGSASGDRAALSVTQRSRSSAGAAAHIQLAFLSLLAGAVLAGGSALGTIGLLVAVALVQALLVLSWVFGTALPGRMGALGIGGLAALAADAATTHWHDSGYSPVLGVLGVAVPVMFVHQLIRGVVRTRVVESLADITVLLLAVVAIAGLIVLRRQGDGDVLVPTVVAAITAGMAASHFTDALWPAPRFDPAVDRGLPAVVVGIVVGGLIGVLSLRHLFDFAASRGAFVGAAVAAVACLLSIGATFSGTHSSMEDPPESAAGFGSGSESATESATESGAGSVSESGLESAGASADASGALPDGRRGARLRPVAATLMTVALSVPAAYVVVNALSS